MPEMNCHHAGSAHRPGDVQRHSDRDRIGLEQRPHRHSEHTLTLRTRTKRQRRGVLLMQRGIGRHRKSGRVALRRGKVRRIDRNHRSGRAGCRDDQPASRTCSPASAWHRRTGNRRSWSVHNTQAQRLRRVDDDGNIAPATSRDDGADQRS